jgi:hypothetical protein
VVCKKEIGKVRKKGEEKKKKGKNCKNEERIFK